MYNVKGPSKIVAKTTRRGISQNIDNFRDQNRNKSFDVEPNNNNIFSVSKPVFHKKTSSSYNRQELISPQHEEIIKFIHESWNSVCSEVEGNSLDESFREHSECTSYYEDEPCVLLQDFKPFDLEAWWGRRLYAYITNSTSPKN